MAAGDPVLEQIAAYPWPRGGVQALVVEVGGARRRPDGPACHIARSLGGGRKAPERNDVIGTVRICVFGAVRCC